MTDWASRLVELHRDRVYRFALSLTGRVNEAEDLAQECFLRAQKYSKQTDELETLRPWLFQIVRNLWFDRQRQKSNQATSNEVQDLDQLVNRQLLEPWQQLDQQERHTEVLGRMMELPDRQREVLFLRTIEELTIDQIAALLQTNTSNVKAHLSHARRRLRETLQFETSSPHPRADDS